MMNLRATFRAKTFGAEARKSKALTALERKAIRGNMADSAASPPLTPVLTPSAFHESGARYADLVPLRVAHLGFHNTEYLPNRRSSRLSKSEVLRRSLSRRSRGGVLPTPRVDKKGKIVSERRAIAKAAVRAVRRLSTLGYADIQDEALIPGDSFAKKKPLAQKQHSSGVGEVYQLHVEPQPYTPHIPHTDVHENLNDALTLAVLLRHSPFAFYCTDMTLLEALAKSCSLVRFTKDEALEDSPFYMIAKGSVRAVESPDGVSISGVRSAGAFINWAHEYKVASLLPSTPPPFRVLHNPQPHGRRRACAHPYPSAGTSHSSLLSRLQYSQSHLRPKSACSDH